MKNRYQYNTKISKQANKSMKKRAAIVSFQKKMIGVAIVLAVSLIVIFGSTMITFANGDQTKTLNKDYTSIEVQSGDTLWSIAEANIKNTDVTIEDYINEVISVNSLSSQEIHSGQYIIIPTYHYDYNL